MNLTPPLARGVAVTGPKTPVAAPVPPSGPVAPIPMDQLPSAPPQVSYQNGMLTIVAQNSSLGDILREVHKSTGAAIDVPPNATERVVARIGPGPARDVLASLLNGSTFNYVMLGSAADPTSVASVMLTTKAAGGPGETVANAYQPPPQQYNMGQQTVMLPGQGPGGPVVQAPAAGDEEADAEEEKDEDTADEDQAQDQAQTGGAVPAQDGSQPNAGPKTPEQILEMLRQRPGQVAPGQPVIPPPNQQQQPPPDDNNN
jgi:hypothetical protein